MEAPQWVGLFFEGLASGTVAASAVINGDVACFAFAVLVVLAIRSFTVDVGRGACRSLVYAVGCTT